jgi:hypothetical protein
MREGTAHQGAFPYQPSRSCSVLPSLGFFPLGVSSPRTVPVAANPAATTAAFAAFWATRLTFDRATDDFILPDFALVRIE